MSANGFTAGRDTEVKTRRHGRRHERRDEPGRWLADVYRAPESPSARATRDEGGVGQ